MTTSSNESDRGLVTARWVTIMDVVFAGIIVFGLENLVFAIGPAFDRSFADFLTQTYAAVAVYVFLIYDVLIYHTLVRDFPYRGSALGAVRFFLDIVMAFTLLAVVVPTCRSAESAAVSLLAGVSLWHLAAAAWHWVAHWEHGRGRPPAARYLPHAGAILAYWTAATLAAAGGGAAPSVAALNAPAPLLALCTLLIAVAVLRTRQLLRLTRTKAHEKGIGASAAADGARRRRAPGRRAA